MPEKYQNAEQDRRLGGIEQHIKVLNDELGKLANVFMELKGAHLSDMEKLRGEMATMNGNICTKLAKIDGKLNWYALTTPLIVGLLSALTIYFITRA